MREARGGTQGAQWLVTLGLVHHWARRQVSQPVSHSEGHLVGPFGPFLRVQAPLGPSGPINFDSPPHFTPT